jgi:hypothetical protein
MSAAKRRGIFCLEGPWSSKLTDRSSVRPLLEVVDNHVESRFIFRDVSTREEAQRLLRQWTQKQYADYPFGILAFHGHPGGIEIGHKSVSLEELGEMLAGRCARRLIHFDSCGVLNVPAREIQAFRLKTKATAVSGFSRRVDWLESAAFTLNLLDALVEGGRISTALTRMKSEHEGAVRKLGFRAVWASGRIGIPGRS